MKQFFFSCSLLLVLLTATVYGQISVPANDSTIAGRLYQFRMARDSGGKYRLLGNVYEGEKMIDSMSVEIDSTRLSFKRDSDRTLFTQTMKGVNLDTFSRERAPEAFIAFIKGQKNDSLTVTVFKATNLSGEGEDDGQHTLLVILIVAIVIAGIIGGYQLRIMLDKKSKKNVIEIVTGHKQETPAMPAENGAHSQSSASSGGLWDDTDKKIPKKLGQTSIHLADEAAKVPETNDTTRQLNKANDEIASLNEKIRSLAKDKDVLNQRIDEDTKTYQALLNIKSKLEDDLNRLKTVTDAAAAEDEAYFDNASNLILVPFQKAINAAAYPPDEATIGLVLEFALRAAFHYRSLVTKKTGPANEAHKANYEFIARQQPLNPLRVSSVSAELPAGSNLVKDVVILLNKFNRPGLSDVLIDEYSIET